MGELDDAQTEVERVLGLAAALEKKERSFDKTVADWHRKHDDLNAELDASQRETRQLGTEAFKLKNMNDEIADQVRRSCFFGTNYKIRKNSAGSTSSREQESRSGDQGLGRSTGRRRPFGARDAEDGATARN